MNKENIDDNMDYNQDWPSNSEGDLSSLELFDALEQEKENNTPSLFDIQKYHKHMISKFFDSEGMESKLEELEENNFTINNLFYGEQEKANLSIMWLSRDRLFNKMSIFQWAPNKIKDHIKDIIHKPSVDKETILKRQDFLEFLNTEDIVNTLKDYPSELSKLDRFRKLRQMSEPQRWKPMRLEIEIFFDNDLDKILTGIETWYTALNDDSIDPPLVLGCIKKYLESLNWLIYFLENNLSDDEYIKYFVLKSKSLLHDFKFDRNFDDVVSEIKQDPSYMQKIINSSDLPSFVRKFLAIIEITTTINNNNLCKVTYDNPQSTYKWWFSPMLNKNDTTINDFEYDEFLTICRAPIWSGKSFWELNVDMYQYIFSQSLWYSCAKEANLRIYKNILFMNRLLSSSIRDDLSALALEWKELERIYNIVKKWDGNSLIYFDETGSTTCEKSEHKIMTKYFEKIKELTDKNNNTVNIRFSTHNQKICDNYKYMDDMVFITFDPDTHKLLEWQRNSDSLQWFVWLLDNLKELRYADRLDHYDDKFKSQRIMFSRDEKNRIIENWKEIAKKVGQYLSWEFQFEWNKYDQDVQEIKFTNKDKESLEKFARPAEIAFYLNWKSNGKESQPPYIRYKDIAHSNNKDTAIFGYGSSLSWASFDFNSSEIWVEREDIQNDGYIYIYIYHIL